MSVDPANRLASLQQGNARREYSATRGKLYGMDRSRTPAIALRTQLADWANRLMKYLA